MSHSTRLPPELLGDIFSMLEWRRDLFAAAGVCRSWSTEAERLLYRSVDTYRLKHRYIDPLLRRLEGPHQIGLHINKLVMIVRTEIVDLVQNLLSVVLNLKWLTLLNKGGGKFNPSLTNITVPFALQIFKTGYRLLKVCKPLYDHNQASKSFLGDQLSPTRVCIPFPRVKFRTCELLPFASTSGWHTRFSSFQPSVPSIFAFLPLPPVTILLSLISGRSASDTPYITKWQET